MLPLTDNPNTSDIHGLTPIHLAAHQGHAEIINILAPLIEHNLNAPANNGMTPIHIAAKKGHLEVIQILAPLSENPNAPDNNGETPIAIAKNTEVRRFLESFCISKTIHEK